MIGRLGIRVSDVYTAQSLYTARIRRKQLYLTDDLDERLKQRAALTGLSEAALVREALELHLEEPGATGDDPILALAGLAGTAPRDRDHAENVGQ